MSRLFVKTAGKPLAGLALVVALAFSPLGLEQAMAYDETSTAAVNVDVAGIALRGYDPVAYFTIGKPTPGDKQFTATYDGAQYLFASAANRDAFVAEPAKFAPAYGGFCAMGAVFGKKLDTDPTLWRVVDGKLYLNVGEPAQKRWLEDVPGNITKANENWPSIMNAAPKAL